jgi:hypothetical protein
MDAIPTEREFARGRFDGVRDRLPASPAESERVTSQRINRNPTNTRERQGCTVDR